MRQNQLLQKNALLFSVMKILGLLPFGINSSSKLTACRLVVPVLYMFCFHAIVMYFACKQMIIIWEEIIKVNCSFDCAVFYITGIIVLLMAVLQLFVFPFKMKEIVEYWDLWDRMQVRYEQITHIQLDVVTKNTVVTWVWLSIIMMIPVAWFSFSYILENHLDAFVAFYIIFLSLSISQIYWIVLSTDLKKMAAGVLKFHCKAFSYWTISQDDLRNCYELWLNVYHLIHHLRVSMMELILIYVVMLSSISVTSGYGLAIYIHDLNKDLMDSRNATSRFVLIFWNIFMSVCSVECTFRLIEEVNHKFIEQMVFISLNGKKMFMQNQIVEFFETFMNLESKITVAGFSDLSRGFLIKVMSTTTTYVIIILQLRDDYLRHRKSNSINNVISSNYSDTIFNA